MESQSAGNALLVIFVATQAAYLVCFGLVIYLCISALRRPSTRSRIGGAALLLFVLAIGPMLLAVAWQLYRQHVAHPRARIKGEALPPIRIETIQNPINLDRPLNGAQEASPSSGFQDVGR
jgi:hypothetical protein